MTEPGARSQEVGVGVVQAWTSRVQSDLAPSEGAMKEPRGWNMGMSRHGLVPGGLAPVDGAMEEPGCQSKGRCRLGQVQGGSAPGEIPCTLKTHE